MVSAAVDRKSTTPSTQQLLSMKGGWRADALPDLIEQFNLTSDEAERIYNELLDLEQKAESEEARA